MYEKGCYRISGVIGSGSSCVVYRTEFVSAFGAVSERLLKEYAPAALHTDRNADGFLVPAPCDREAYDAGLQRFFRACQLQEKIRRISGLTNSTSISQNIFEANGTGYIDMPVMEGQVYTDAPDATLYQLLRHMKALTRVIGNYHKAGFLHLDVKPDNIFVYPETPDMLLLFDFDSVVEKDHILAARGLSYTEQWAAPEQLNPAKWQKICEATDLYPIGEILFTRLFGRHSDTADRRSFSSFRYDPALPLLKNVDPRVFPLLTELLHKTICGMPEKRYQHADELLQLLDKLISLADPSRTFVKSNFTYQSAAFRGREDLLCAIHAFFCGQSQSRGNALFLSGVGGIGKTELAKRYAALHQKEYTRILFLPFQNSIRETLCQGAFEIYHSEPFPDEAKDPKQDSYDAILRVLKEDLTPQDLLILDNFDTFDETIEDLLDIDCKILVTTRLDVSDYDYPQETVGPIDEMDTLLEIFRQYDPLEYPEDECAQIEALINYVDRHTMTVCLMAKYLRIRQSLPSALLETLRTREGITAAQDSTRVGHRKDRRLASESIPAHLRILFDLNRFSQNETDFLTALSLFGPVRIAKSALQKLFGTLYREDILQDLEKTGWVEVSGDGFISLHQIILDLAYTTLVQKCTSFAPVVQGMLQYVQENTQSQDSRQGKCTLVKFFLDRIYPCLEPTDESSLSVADLHYHSYRSGLYSGKLEKAAQICRCCSTQRSRELLFRIELLRIEDAGAQYEDHLFHGVSERFVQPLTDEVLADEAAAWRVLFADAGKAAVDPADVEAHIAQLAMPDAAVCGEADAAKLSAFLLRFPVLPEPARIRPDCIEKLLQLADTMESVASSFCRLETELAEGDAAYPFFLEQECILRYAYLLAVTTGQDIALLEQCLQALSDFYSESDYALVARWSCFSDPFKMQFYVQEFRELRQSQSPDAIVVDYFDVADSEPNLEAAATETRHGNYQKAIRFLMQALETSEGPEETILSRISWNYIKLYLQSGMLQDAYDSLVDHLAYDQQHGFSDLSTMMTLADVCKRMGRTEESVRWYTTLLDKYFEAYDTLTDDEKYDLLLSCFLRAELDSSHPIDAALGKWLRERLTKFDDAESWTDDKLAAVYQKAAAPFRQLFGFRDTVDLLLSAAGKLQRFYSTEAEAEALYTLVCEMCMQEHRDADLCFDTALKALAPYSRGSLSGHARLLEILEELSRDPQLISELNLERYHILQADQYFWREDRDPDTELRLKKKCNYYLVAEHDAAECELVDDAMTPWERARNEYLTVGNYEAAKRCCLRLSALRQQTSTPYLLCSFQENYEKQLAIERQLGDTVGISACIGALYDLWGVLAAQDDNMERQLTDSMERVIETVASIPNAPLAIFIGLVRIHRLLSGKTFALPSGSLLSDEQALRAQTLQLAGRLPEAVPEDLRDPIRKTLQVILPLCRSVFEEGTTALERLQKACAVHDVEEKHPT